MCASIIICSLAAVVLFAVMFGMTVDQYHRAKTGRIDWGV